MPNADARRELRGIPLPRRWVNKVLGASSPLYQPFLRASQARRLSLCRWAWGWGSPLRGCEFLVVQGVAEQVRAALRAASNPRGVGGAALVIVEVDHEAERLLATHLRPEGVSAVWAWIPHAYTISRPARQVMALKAQHLPLGCSSEPLGGGPARLAASAPDRLRARERRTGLLPLP